MSLGRSAAERRYPTPKVRGRDRERQAVTESAPLWRHKSRQEELVRGGGWEKLPHVWGQGPRPRGATPRPRKGGCTGAGGQEELLHIQGQEGRPHPR